MIIQITREQFPFHTESDLGAEIIGDYINPVETGESTVMPIEMILADRELLSHIIKTDSWFEISAEDMAEVKEKNLILWPVTEQLFKIKTKGESVCQS